MFTLEFSQLATAGGWIVSIVSALAAAKYAAREAHREAREAMRRADAAHKRLDEHQTQQTEILLQLREMKVSLSKMPAEIAAGFYEKLIVAGVYKKSAE